MGKSQKQNYKYNLSQQSKASYVASQKIEEILDYFGIEYTISNKTILAKCPVHGGDNPTALNIYPDNNSVPGAWVCNTAQCHKRYSSNIYGFIQGILSTPSKKITYEEAVDWIMKFLGWSQEKTDDSNFIQNNRFNKISKIEKKKLVTTKWMRDSIRKNLIIPADYYLRRHYSSNILSKYDIGINKKNGRIYIPIYDNDYKYAVGFTSRSQYEKCNKCNKYHDHNASCPNYENKTFSKWVNSPVGFNKSQYLFNYWFAKPHIKKTKTAILVEGIGDALKLEDNDIHGVVGTFGLSLSEDQKLLLEKLGVITVVCLYDNDEAGKQAKQNLNMELSRSFNLHFPSFNSKDIGESSPEELKNIQEYIGKIQ